MFKRILFISLLFISTPALAGKDCTCSHKGAKTPEGQLVCIKTHRGLEMAQCSRVLNNTSWKFLGTPCPSANLNNNKYQSKFDIELATKQLKNLG